MDQKEERGRNKMMYNGRMDRWKRVDRRIVIGKM